MAECANCGEEIDSDAKECEYCGYNPSDRAKRGTGLLSTLGKAQIALGIVLVGYATVKRWSANRKTATEPQ